VPAVVGAVCCFLIRLKRVNRSGAEDEAHDTCVRVKVCSDTREARPGLWPTHLPLRVQLMLAVAEGPQVVLVVFEY
jgi:hypothetical protein